MVILAGEFLREAKAFVEEGVHPQSIIRSFREAGRLAVEEISRQAVVLADKSDAEMRDLLQKCAATSLNSKLVSSSAPRLDEALAKPAVLCWDTPLVGTTLQCLAYLYNKF